jgi:hypothetical protein
MKGLNIFDVLVRLPGIIVSRIPIPVNFPLRQFLGSTGSLWKTMINDVGDDIFISVFHSHVKRIDNLWVIIKRFELGHVHNIYPFSDQVLYPITMVMSITMLNVVYDEVWTSPEGPVLVLTTVDTRWCTS